MQERNPIIQRNKTCMELVLLLLFPEYQVNFSKLGIGLIKDEKVVMIDKTHFDSLQEILLDMFNLREIFKNSISYNPANKRA